MKPPVWLKEDASLSAATANPIVTRKTVAWHRACDAALVANNSLLCVLLMSASLWVAVQPASAQTIAEAPALQLSEEASPPEWYGWQILLVHAANGALIPAFIGVKAPPLAYVVPLVLYLGAGPIVHGIHGRTGRAFISLGMRLAMPLVIGAIVSGIAGATSDTCDETDTHACPWFGPGASGAIWGGFIGLLIAPLVDAFAISPVPQSASTQTQSSALVLPMLHVGASNTVGLVVAVTF